MSSYVNKIDYRVIFAGNGSEALDTLRAQPDISLVVLDLTMPVMTGEQAIPLIKGIRPAVPIILSSGFSETEIARRFSGWALPAYCRSHTRLWH